MRFLPSNRVWAASTHSSNTTRHVCIELYPPASLTDPSQQIQDVKDKLEDLVPWVIKLKDTLTAANAKDDHEEERRAQLAKFASRSATDILPR